MSSPVELGSLLQHNGRECLVVRIVESSTLFEDPETGKCSIVEEQYAELRTADGQVEFMPPVKCLVHEFTKPETVKIKGVNSNVWRKF